MISINKYGQNLDLTKINEVNGKKSFSISGLDANNTLIINVTKGMKFKSILEENDLKIEFTDIDGSVFELVLKDMATLLAQNDGQKLVEIIQSNDNKVLASITDITSALEAAAAGPAAGNNTNSDSGVTNEFGTDGLAFENNNYDNARFDNAINGTRVFPDFVVNPAPILANPAVTPGIIPINSSPVITVNTTATVNEDEVLIITFTANDIDADILTSSVTATNGTAIINANGDIEFTPNENFNGSAVITLTVNDGTVSTVQTINVTVNPVNDAPILDTITEVAVNEDDSLFSGTITSTDVDNNSTATYTTTSTVSGFTLNSDGTYTFNAADEAYQSLEEGEVETITIPVTVTDDQGATDTKNLVITITGVNDAPTISNLTVTLDTVLETAFSSVEGFPNAYHVINGQALYAKLGVEDYDDTNIQLEMVAGSVSLLVTNSNPADYLAGTVVILTQAIIDQYDIKNAVVGDFLVYSKDIDSLEENDNVEVTFQVQAYDGQEYSAKTSTITLNITGVNDAPTISNLTVTLDTVLETAFSSVEGFPNAYHVINGQALYAKLGVEDYDDTNIQLEMVAGSVSLLVTNSNPADYLAGTVVILTQAIIDQYDIKNAVVGDFLVYSKDIDSLEENDNVEVTFQVQAYDGQEYSAKTSTITLNITGVNDAPTISNLTVTLDTVLETAFSSVEGFPNAYHVINGQALYAKLGVEDYDDTNIQLEMVAGSVSLLVTNSNPADYLAGTVVILTQAIIDQYDIKNAVVGDFLVYSKDIDSLEENDNVEVTFQVQAYDGQEYSAKTSTITLNITGVNDAPTISNLTVTLDTVLETAFSSVEGFPNAYHVINGQALYAKLGVEDYDDTNIQLEMVAGSVSLLVTDSNPADYLAGTVVILTQAIIDQYDIKNAVVGDFLVYSKDIDSLEENDNVEVTFQVQAYDGQEYSAKTSTITLNITGVNDAPTISNLTVTLDTVLETAFSSVEGFPNAYHVINGQALYAKLGVEDYDDTNIQLEMVAGSVSLLVTNSNPADYLAGTVVILTQAIIDQYDIKNAVAGDFLVYSKDIDSLEENDNVEVTFQVQAYDGQEYSAKTSTITLNITGVNDAPTISNLTVTLDTVLETAFSSVEGFPNAYHVINGQALYAKLGVEDYDDTNIQLEMVAGSVSLLVTNSNPADYLAGTVVILTQAIIDQYDIKNAVVGDFLVYSKDIDSLEENDNVEVTFQVQAYDGQEYSAKTSTITLNITGVNDAPTISNLTVTLDTVLETAFSSVEGFPNAYHVINGQALYAKLGVEDYDDTNIQLEMVAGSVSLLVTNSNPADYLAGTVVILTQAIIDQYDIKNAVVGDFLVYSKDIDSLEENDNVEVTFQVQAYDGQEYSAKTSTITLNITGVNDAPVVKSITLDIVENDLAAVNGKENVIFEVLANSENSLNKNVSDAEKNDTHTFERVGKSVGLTITTINSGLKHAFADDQIEYIRETALKLFAIPEVATALASVTDPKIQGLIYQVKNAIDVPQLLGLVNGIKGISVGIDAGVLKLEIKDAQILESANLLKIKVNADGSYSVESPLFNNLSVTDTVSLSFDYRAKDSAGAYSDADTVTLNVKGSNDPLTTKNVTISVDENQLDNTNNTKLDIGINSKYALNNYTYDKDVLDDFNYERANAKVGLTISTTSSGLFYAFKDNQIEYIRDVALKLFAIPEIKTVLNSITDINALTFINQLKGATSVPTLLLLVKSIGINLDVDLATKTIKLQIEDARILEQNGLLKITIEGDGSYSVESPLFNNLSVVDTVNLSFEYIATDSGGATTLPKVITVNVAGSNDPLTTKDVSININENDLKSNNTTLTVAIDSQYALNNNTLDVDVLDDADYHRSGEKLGLTISTSDTGLLTAVASNDLAYVKSVVLKLISIPEVSLVLNSIKDVNILTLINTLKSASSLTQLIGMVNSIDGIKLGMDTTTGTLKLEIADAKILEKNNLVKIDIVDNGSYTIESPLFNNLSPNDKVSLSFDYIGTDSGGATTEPKTITLNVTGANDSPTANISATIVSSKAVSYVGQLVANDVDINDKVTYSYDKSSVSMTFAMDGINNINSLLSLNNPLAIQALGELKTVGMNFVNNGNILTLTTLSSQTIATSKVAISVLKDFLDSNVGLKGDIISLKNFILTNKEAIVAHTSIVAQDIVLLETLITENNIIALGKIFDSLQTFVSDPIAKAAITSILADNVISPAELAYLAPYQVQIEALLDIPTIVSKLQEVFTFDAVNGEVSAHINVPSSLAEHMIVLDANTGEYTINNPYLSSLPDSTQVEINFNYKATDSFGAIDNSTASILITSENVAKISASLDDNGSLTFGDEKDIDMGSLLSNITSNINVSDIDSIDLSSNEHILSNLTIADFEEMVSDTASSTLSIKGENDDIVKLDLTNIWKKDLADTDLNSVVDTLDDNFIAYTATGTHNQVLTLLIDKDIIVQDI